MGPTVTLFGKLISHHKNINQKKKKTFRILLEFQSMQEHVIIY